MFGALNATPWWFNKLQISEFGLQKPKPFLCPVLWSLYLCVRLFLLILSTVLTQLLPIHVRCDTAPINDLWHQQILLKSCCWHQVGIEPKERENTNIFPETWSIPYNFNWKIIEHHKTTLKTHFLTAMICQCAPPGTRQTTAKTTSRVTWSYYSVFKGCKIHFTYSPQL